MMMNHTVAQQNPFGKRRSTSAAEKLIIVDVSMFMWSSLPAMWSSVSRVRSRMKAASSVLLGVLNGDVSSGVGGRLPHTLAVVVSTIGEGT